ncbi:MAG TPA: hypothetical protein VER79_10785 [Candidatus Limnocylindrales bacterium]|nr:hypothetical protein [Candidatus Limnocylindrales bacterium]
MASGMTQSKRFAVRLSLVTSSTVAMIIGAQSLATLDQVNAAPADNNTTAITQIVTIAQAAPSITILRHAGTTVQAAPSVSISPRSSSGQPAAQMAAQPAVRPQSVMQPPVPVVVPAAASAPQIPSVPTTQSSR